MRIELWLEIVFPFYPDETVATRNHSNINRTSYRLCIRCNVPAKRCEIY